ncbi:MAG: glutamate--tRNA ligase family protein, partial [Verrucomicrobiota bacterium]|nr:glutamate--tRNA ligase family protein [Verrucomicrobiota bacterium]
LRIEDLDVDRCRAEFCDGLEEDLRWFGLRWDEGPYLQSERRTLYRDAFEKLRAGKQIYACTCSRRDVMSAASAPHSENDEPIYPGTCREKKFDGTNANWRFRVPDGELIEFTDANFGPRTAIAGKDFGDFLVWRKDDVPAYQLAVAVDDAAMEVTEVVRGADLVVSTFRQLLIYRALELHAPDFFHAPLVTDENGRRLAKRHAALSLRALRQAGADPENLREQAAASLRAKACSR